MVRKLLIILSGSAGTALLSLIRNLLIAALIPVEDYGIAATFAMAMSVVEMMSTIGLQQQIVQSKRGNDPEFQAALQGFHLFRGVLAGGVLFLAAGWIAAFLGIPEVAWAYQVMALVPIFTGLQHYDMHRLKRQMRFGPFILSEIVPVAISLAISWPLALWLGDYRVMLIAIVTQMALRAGVSHWVAERRYSLSLDTTIIKGALRFGWPLLFNNLLLFIVLNGEKVVVGRVLGMESLAILAMGFTLTLTPTMVLAKTLQNFFLPQLSATQSDPEAFSPIALATLQAALLNGCIVVVLVLVLGAPFVTLTLGEKYGTLGALIVWMGLLNAIRVFKSGAAVVALARGQTANAMIANSFRVLSLPLSVLAASSGQGLLVVIWIATLGEICGVIVAYALVWRRAGVPVTSMRLPLIVTIALLAIVAVFAGHAMLPDALQSAVPQWAVGAAAIVALVGLALTVKDVHRYLKTRSARGFQDG